MKQHIKRISAPASWNILRKEETYMIRPKPGGQSLALTLPLASVLRMAGIAKTMKDVKYLLSLGKILVCGRVRKDPKFPVGFLDTMTIPDDKQAYRLSIDRKGSLCLIAISEAETGLKIAAVRDILKRKDGFTYALSDGRVLKLPTRTAPTKSGALITLPDQAVKEMVPLAIGVHVFLITGKHKGVVGDVRSIADGIITIHTQESTFTAPANAVLVVGKDKPLITLN